MGLQWVLERDVLPDGVLRAGIRALLRQRLKEESRGGVEAQGERLQRFLEELRSSPVAVETAAANEQHYEVPTRFYELCLGPRLKYSSGYYERPEATLAEAEESMLALTCARAELADGQRVLELGCGWGSLTLWMAERYPGSRITAVSNSRSQREHIESEAARRGLRNVEVITCDMNRFEPSGRFDRVVSVEMFEHMKNYRVLMGRIAKWLAPEGRLFVHIFVHRLFAYPFEARDETDWMARYFFTGGMMPSDTLLLHFQEEMECVRQWRVSGRHYERTANHWLENMDRNEGEVREVLRRVYGAELETRWWVYWRVFFMACAELWGYCGGDEWHVSHYLFRPRAAREA